MTKVKKEITERNTYIVDEIIVNEDNTEVEVYCATMLDASDFGLALDEETWVNMYASYNVYDDKLNVVCTVNSDSMCEEYPYTPTENEMTFLKNAIFEAVKKRYDMTPKELCETAF